MENVLINGGKMTQYKENIGDDSESLQEILSCSGYSDKAIEEYRSKKENNLQGE